MRIPRARRALVDAAVPYFASHGTNAVADIATPQVTYTWDDFGRKLKETDPLNKEWKFEYDLHNNLTKTTDAKNQVTQFAYSDRGLLLTRIDASGKKTAYTYNALGQVLLAQSPEVAYGHAYDAAHRLASITDSRGGKKLSYAYPMRHRQSGRSSAPIRVSIPAW